MVLHRFYSYFEYFISSNFHRSAISSDDRLASSIGAPTTRGIYGLVRYWSMRDSGEWDANRRQSAAIGRPRRARVRNHDDFSGAMRSSSSHGWSFGQRSADDQEKSSERCIFQGASLHRLPFL